MLASGIPPGTANVGEIILGDLLRAYPRDRVCAFVAPADGYAPAPDPELGHIPIRLGGPRYDGLRHRSTGRLATATSILDFRRRYRRVVSVLADAATAFGRAENVEMVFSPLDSATFMALGAEVATRLGVPLVTLVWDAPEYVLAQQGLDRISRRCLLAEFGASLRRSTRVAVVSDAMAEEYTRRYGVQTILLRHGLASSLLRPPAERLASPRRVTIGFAGSMYAPGPLRALLDALSRVRWTIAGREVT
jgi:hypothetical protein